MDSWPYRHTRPGYFTILFALNAGSFYRNKTTYDLSSTSDSIRLSLFDWQVSLGTGNKEKIDVTRGNKEKLIRYLVPDTEEVIVINQTTPFIFYDLEVKAIGQPLIYKPSVPERLKPVLRISLDSAYAWKEGYILHYQAGTIRKEADADHKNPDDIYGKVYGPLRGLAGVLQNRYNMPFSSADTAYAEFFYNNQLSMESQIKELEQRHGIVFTKTRKKMLIIIVKDL